MSVEKEVLVHEDCGELWPLTCDVQLCTLAPTSPRRDIGQAQSNQSAGHAKP